MSQSLVVQTDFASVKVVAINQQNVDFVQYTYPKLNTKDAASKDARGSRKAKDYASHMVQQSSVNFAVWKVAKIKPSDGDFAKSMAPMMMQETRIGSGSGNVINQRY